MNSTAKILLVFVLAHSTIDPSLASQYELQIDEDNPTRGTVRLVFDSALESDTEFIVRNLRESYIENPVCVTTGTKLVRQETGWLARAGCSEISWESDFTEALRPEHNVSAQTNLYYSGKWWLFSEWGNLLRPASGTGESEICAENGTIRTCRRIPATEEPPLLMLIGETANRMVFGETTFNFFTGHLPNSFDVTDLHESYRRQISYLHSALAGTSDTSSPDAIDVLLLGIDSAHGVVGGAAGYGSYLANVAVTERQVDPSERTRLLWISGHELAHLLGLGTEVLWASESLAHYYGFKSLGENTHASEYFEKMMEDVDRMGLLEAHRRVTQEGKRQYYPQFYTKGSHFWKEIDEAIGAASQGDRNLDHFLPLLIDGNFGLNGQLPPDFVEEVSEIAGREKIERIIREYL